MKPLFLSAAAILCCLLLAGCPAVDTDTDADSSTDTNAGTGTVHLTMSSGDGSQSITPGFSSYSISFDGPAAVDTVSVTETSSRMELAVGTWTLTVEALNASGSVVASGRSAALEVTDGATTEAPVTIGSDASGTGTIVVNVTWPSSLSRAIDGCIVELDGVPVDAAAVSFNPTTRTLAYTETKSAGTYTLGIFLMSAYNPVHYFSKTALVYANAESRATIARTSADFSTAQIIADHTVVDRYDDIPTEYIAVVKKMWFDLPGESHSAGYRNGLQYLEDSASAYAVNITESGTPETATSSYLRVSKATYNGSGWSYGYGEADWYTSSAAITKTKAHLDYCNTNGYAIAAMGFGWCWDMTWMNAPGGTMDPVYKVRWAGSSVGGPEGNLIWGLDADDYALTSNSVCMDTYLAATQAYIDYCSSQGYATKVFFTTGPIEGASGENAYQRYLKHTHIRNYVLADSSRILFDYADILSYNDTGTLATSSWTDSDGATHVFPNYNSDNDASLGYSGDDGDHIGQTGALRLGKAVWWMLARMAGWSG